MKNLYKYLFLGLFLCTLTACDLTNDWLEREPETILTDEQVWNSPEMINSVITDVYARLPHHTDFGGPVVCMPSGSNYCGWQDYTAYDEAIWAGVSNPEFEARNNLINYPFLRWSLWNYDLIRDINLAIENIEESTSAMVTDELKLEFISELRFVRALNYFILVKRMGGVPIITEQLIYDFSGDPSSLQHPRNTEEEVYDFIASELDDIIGSLGNHGSQTRANDYTALALKSRAMLYAGSIAKNNNEMSNPITLPDGEVGIPAERADDYFELSLNASREIIESGAYMLYNQNPHAGENFYEAVSSKSNNNEVILAVDYDRDQGVRHLFTVQNIPRELREDQVEIFGGSAISPSLNLVEKFDYLDGSSGELQGVGDGTVSGQSDWIFYDNPDEIFENKDPRLYGTIIYPGSEYNDVQLNIQAGVYVWNDDEGQYDRIEGDINSTYDDGGVLTGPSGPKRNENYVSATGFYLRKYLDPSPGAATGAVQSDMWWVWFRLGEIYLNGAEAAYELGLDGEALDYINRLRERAGFGPNSLASVDIERIRNERSIELAFEDHRVWDLKRWRIAHDLWDGSSGNPDANVYALFPYRVVHPGHENDGKYVFDKFPAPRQLTPRFFRMGNYYSQIPQDVLDNNPSIIRNPFH